MINCFLNVLNYKGIFDIISVSFKFNRIMSALIDGFVMLVLLIGITIMPSIAFLKDTMAGHFILSDTLWMLFSFFGAFCVWILYLFVTSLIFSNATLGMKLNKLTFARSNGTNMSFRYLLFRSFTIVVCLVFSLGFSLIVDLISTICSDNGKTFYDIVSLTKVVRLDDFQ